MPIFPFSMSGFLGKLEGVKKKKWKLKWQEELTTKADSNGEKGEEISIL